MKNKIDVIGIPCPFVYASGDACPGHVVEIEARTVRLNWYLNDDKSAWDGTIDMTTKIRFRCSDGFDHGGFGRMEFWFEQLLPTTQEAIEGLFRAVIFEYAH